MDPRLQHRDRGGYDSYKPGAAAKRPASRSPDSANKRKAIKTTHNDNCAAVQRKGSVSRRSSVSNGQTPWPMQPPMAVERRPSVVPTSFTKENSNLYVQSPDSLGTRSEDVPSGHSTPLSAGGMPPKRNIPPQTGDGIEKSNTASPYDKLMKLLDVTSEVTTRKWEREQCEKARDRAKQEIINTSDNFSSFPQLMEQKLGAQRKAKKELHEVTEQLVKKRSQQKALAEEVAALMQPPEPKAPVANTVADTPALNEDVKRLGARIKELESKPAQRSPVESQRIDDMNERIAKLSIDKASLLKLSELATDVKALGTRVEKVETTSPSTTAFAPLRAMLSLQTDVSSLQNRVDELKQIANEARSVSMDNIPSQIQDLAVDAQRIAMETRSELRNNNLRPDVTRLQTDVAPLKTSNQDSVRKLDNLGMDIRRQLEMEGKRRQDAKDATAKTLDKVSHDHTEQSKAVNALGQELRVLTKYTFGIGDLSESRTNYLDGLVKGHKSIVLMAENALQATQRQQKESEEFKTKVKMDTDDLKTKVKALRGATHEEGKENVVKRMKAYDMLLNNLVSDPPVLQRLTQAEKDIDGLEADVKALKDAPPASSTSTPPATTTSAAGASAPSGVTANTTADARAIRERLRHLEALPVQLEALKHEMKEVAGTRAAQQDRVATSAPATTAQSGSANPDLPAVVERLEQLETNHAKLDSRLDGVDEVTKNLAETIDEAQTLVTTHVEGELSGMEEKLRTEIREADEVLRGNLATGLSTADIATRKYVLSELGKAMDNHTIRHDSKLKDVRDELEGLGTEIAESKAAARAERKRRDTQSTTLQTQVNQLDTALAKATDRMADKGLVEQALERKADNEWAVGALDLLEKRVKAFTHSRTPTPAPAQPRLMNGTTTSPTVNGFTPQANGMVKPNEQQGQGQAITLEQSKGIWEKLNSFTHLITRLQMQYNNITTDMVVQAMLDQLSTVYPDAKNFQVAVNELKGQLTFCKDAVKGLSTNFEERAKQAEGAKKATLQQFAEIKVVVGAAEKRVGVQEGRMGALEKALLPNKATNKAKE